MAQTEFETVAGEAAASQPSPLSGWQDRLRQGRVSVAGLSFNNPVLVKEFRTRMRGTRAYWILLIYTLLLAGVLAMMYFSYEVSITQQFSTTNSGPNSGAQDLGRAIYYFVFIAQALMVALITPAITAGTLTIEREQRSYELLVTTPLRPGDLVRGKLAAAVAFVVLLLTASVPLVSISFLVGGVSPAEIFFSYLILACSAFLYGTIGIFWSATLRTTAAATVVTYLTVLTLFILTSFPGMLAGSVAAGLSASSPIPFQSLNPIAAVFRAVQPEHLFAAQIPSWVSGVTMNLLLGMVIMVGAMGRLEHFDPPSPAWLRSLSTLLWCAFGSFAFGAVIGGMGTTWTTSTIRDPMLWIHIWMLVLVALATPVFNTGDLVLRSGENALRRYCGGFLPHRALDNDLPNGYPLVLGWAILLFALVPIGLFCIGKLQVVPVVSMLLPAWILSFAIYSALAGVGQLLSVTLPSRWAACILTYLFGVLTMLLPYFTLFPWFQLNRPRTIQLWQQVLYLVPFEGLIQLWTPKTYLADRPPLLFGTTVPVWVVTSALYALGAALCFGLTSFYVVRAGKRMSTRA